MKKSEKLRSQAEMEDNDLKAMGIYTKVLREERKEKFEEKHLNSLLIAGFNVTEHEDQGKFTIEPTDYGIVDYYPKANKILIRKQNKWIKPGLQWIVKKLLKSK